jgi:hypothetical protein
VPLEIKALFFHDLPGVRMDFLGIEAGAMDFKAVPGILLQEGLGHLTADSITGA